MPAATPLLAGTLSRSWERSTLIAPPRWGVSGAACRADHDTQLSDELRLVQLTPPGSACSIMIGTGLSDMEPGSLEGLQLTVTDMDAVRGELVDRGVEVSEVKVLGAPGRPGFKHAWFRDPDGNAWTLQEIRD
jgi:hypothetical protein